MSIDISIYFITITNILYVSYNTMLDNKIYFKIMNSATNKVEI